MAVPAATLAELVKLPPEDCEQVIAALEASLVSPEDRDAERAYWQGELARRIADYDSGRVKALSIEESLEEIDNALAGVAQRAG
jgi:putative addiction module component (TIGR02574 family)